MGNLEFSSKCINIPKYIMNFIYSKINLHIDFDNNKTKLGFYILQQGVNKCWTYYYNNDIVIITYNLDINNK